MKKVITRENGSTKVTKVLEGPSRTDQSHKERADINNLMKQYRAIGVGINNMPNPSRGSYGDFSAVKDYKSAMDQIIKAQNSFMSLDAMLRKRFNNDPYELIQFLADEKNLEEAIKLKLVAKPVVQNDDDSTTTIQQQQQATPTTQA